MNIVPSFTFHLGKWKFDPQPDLTPLEAIYLCQLFVTISSFARVAPIEDYHWKWFAEKKAILRHFTESTATA